MKLSKIYKELLSEDLTYSKTNVDGPEDDEFMIGKDLSESIDLSTLRFNDGKFNKTGPNTIYMDENPIVDFGVGQIGDINVNGVTYSNAIYLQGGYNASKQKMGYGSVGIEYLFYKLPKIQYIILQCVDSAKGFWDKLGAKVIDSKKWGESNELLYTMLINRS